MDYNQLVKKQFAGNHISRPDWTVDTSRPEGLLWLNKNENIDPKLNECLQNILKDLRPWTLNTYPENAKIYKKLAHLNKLKPHNFLLTSGSDGAIRNVFEVFINPGDVVLHSHPTFAMYDVYSKMYAAKQVKVTYQYTDKGPKLDFDQFLQEIKNHRPKLVCLPNPDSPSGTVILVSQMRQLLDVTKETQSLLLIDEAYFPFYQETVLPLITEYPQLLVCRSFSKAWGAAGVRVGFLAGQEPLMKLIHQNRCMYELGTLSAEVIYRLLDHEQDVLDSVKRLQEARDYFKSELEKMNYFVTESHGNFMHICFGEDEKRISEVLKDTVLFRTEFGEANSLKGFSRFSLGTKEQFEKILNKIRSIK